MARCVLAKDVDELPVRCTRGRHGPLYRPRDKIRIGENLPMTNDLDSLFPRRSEPTLTTEPSDITFESVLAGSYMDDDLRARIQNVNVLIVPQVEFRETAGLTFPSGTEDLLLHLREGLPAGTSVEIAIRDEDYRELSLREALVIVATILVASQLVAPVVVNVVSDWLKRKLGRQLPKAEVKAEIIVVDKDGKSIAFRYEGPARTFEETMLKQLSRGEDGEKHRLDE